MKYSIILVSYNAPEKLLKCLESLLANPPGQSPYTSKADAEIILIDNSPERIEAHIKKPLFIPLLQTYEQMIVEWHPENVGFAEGCNIGARKASGEYLVFMNPDTEVFPEWAERMTDHFVEGVGAVGPISNFVAGFQNMYFHMKKAKDWETTAKHARKGLHKRSMDTKMLIGFFFMIRKETWDKVGGMDPQFFLGCDDLDLSLRLRDAGYSLSIATDVFVYHEGHASFKTSDASQNLNKQSEKKMLDKLYLKYGKDIPTSTELWGCEILPTYVPKRQTLSILMIVKDEQEKAKLPIADVDFADECIVVDTGSSPVGRWILAENDGKYSAFTPQDTHVASAPFRRNPAKKLYFHEWRDSFAEARNFALSKCTGDWVLWLDADDRVTPENAKLIRAALDNPGPMTQAKTCHFCLRIRDDGPNGFNYLEAQPRLFPRLPGLEWVGRVHETYIPAAEKLGLAPVICDITIDHTGYKDPVVMLRKHARNLRLMQMEEPSPHKFYHMGKSYQGLSQAKEAEECYTRVLDTQWDEPLQKGFRDHVRYCLATLIYSVKPGGCEEMIPYLEGNGKPDALFLLAEVHYVRGDYEAAHNLYTQYIGMDIRDSHASETEYFKSFAESRLKTIIRTPV